MCALDTPVPAQEFPVYRERMPLQLLAYLRLARLTDPALLAKVWDSPLPWRFHWGDGETGHRRTTWPSQPCARLQYRAGHWAPML